MGNVINYIFGKLKQAVVWQPDEKAASLMEIGAGGYQVKSMLVNKDFQTWLLIGWQLCCQPIRCQAWKSALTNMDFNMEIY